MDEEFTNVVYRCLELKGIGVSLGIVKTDGWISLGAVEERIRRARYYAPRSAIKDAIMKLVTEGIVERKEIGVVTFFRRLDPRDIVKKKLNGV